MSDRLKVLKKGLKHPTQVPPHVVGRLLPNSRWGPSWYRENGFITFDDGEFAGGAPSRAELSARIFYEAGQLESVLAGRGYERSLEIGCGYGRLSGWISRFAERAVAIEPNAEVVDQAEVLYPDVEFHETTADDLPFEDDRFDLGVSWSVLSHVPPDSIEDAAAETVRVLRPDATLVLCEKTRGEEAAASWPRPASAYERLFDPFEVTSVSKRRTEPTFSYGDRYDLLVLERR